jgi:hypothetical protein
MYDEQLELLSMPGTKVTLRAYNLAERFVLLNVVAIPGVNISSLGQNKYLVRFPYPGSNLPFPQPGLKVYLVNAHSHAYHSVTVTNLISFRPKAVTVNSTHLNFHLHIPISNALPVDRQWVTVLNSSIPILDGVYEVSETSGTNAITVSRNRGGGIQDGEYTLSAILVSNMKLYVKSMNELAFNATYNVPCLGKVTFSSKKELLEVGKKVTIQVTAYEGSISLITASNSNNVMALYGSNIISNVNQGTLISLKSKSFPVLNKHFVVQNIFSSHVTIKDLRQKTGIIHQTVQYINCTAGDIFSKCLFQGDGFNSAFLRDQRIILHNTTLLRGCDETLSGEVCFGHTLTSSRALHGMSSIVIYPDNIVRQRGSNAYGYITNKQNGSVLSLLPISGKFDTQHQIEIVYATPGSVKGVFHLLGKIVGSSSNFRIRFNGSVTNCINISKFNENDINTSALTDNILSSLQDLPYLTNQNKIGVNIRTPNCK